MTKLRTYNSNTKIINEGHCEPAEVIDIVKPKTVRSILSEYDTAYINSDAVVLHDNELYVLLDHPARSFVESNEMFQHCLVRNDAGFQLFITIGENRLNMSEVNEKPDSSIALHIESVFIGS